MPDNNLKKRFNRAMRYERIGDYNKARHEYLTILKADKKYREVYLNLGALYSRMNNFTNAMKCFSNALKLGKDYITYFNIGSIYYKMKQYKKAIFNLEKSRKLNNTFSLSILVIGLCYSMLKNYIAAKKNFKQVLAIEPGNIVSLSALTLIYYNQQLYEQSLHYLEELLAKDSSNIKFRDLKSDLLLQSNRFDEFSNEIKILKTVSNGFTYYDKFIESVPVDVYTDKYGTMSDKIQRLEDKTKTNKNNENLISLSLCHMLQGDTDKALDYLFQINK